MGFPRKHWVVGFWMALAGAAMGGVQYAPKNIAWGEVSVSDVERVEVAPVGLAAFSAGAPEVREKRTLTLPSGNRLRITERIETDAQGEEARIFLEGKQLSEITVVATNETLAQVLDLLQARGYAVVARYGRTGRILRVRLPLDEQSEACALLGELAQLGVESAAHSQVRFFVPRAEIVPSATPNDPLYAQQWGLRQIGVPEVWKQGYLGFPNIPCAVYDTGVHLTHEDLQINVKTRVSALHSSADPEDHHGHGSHCLGIMGADANNGKGVVGVGQVADLTSIRGPISYWQEGDSILDGFQYALDHGIKVLSCSFGTPAEQGSFDASEYAMLEELNSAGVLVVVAAGNDGNNNDQLPTYPASYECENILTVIASDKRDQPVKVGQIDQEGSEAHVWSTCYGAVSCDIAAPGSDILSCTKEADNAYESWDGTSMATPMVAACAAMVWEQNPSWSAIEVKQRLLSTVDTNPALLGYCQTGGRVNLLRALDTSAGYISVAPMAQTAIPDGQPLSLTVTAEHVQTLTFTLYKQGDENFSQDLGSHLLGGEKETLSVELWTPTKADKGRGYYIRVAAQDREDTVFAYSSLFRVKDASVPETLAVSVAQTDGLVTDADRFAVTVHPSDAALVDLILDERPAAGNDWQIAATLGRVVCTPGQDTTVNVQLKGRGWLAGEYRVRAVDVDAPEVVGYSNGTPETSAEAPGFGFARSTCSVYMLLDETEETPADYRQQKPTYDARWQANYPAGTPFTLNCWLPESSLYWLYLVEEIPTEDGQGTELQIYLLKQTWTDASTQTIRSFRRFQLAFPERFANGHTYWLRLYDAFAPEMYHDSPSFTISARTDGRTPANLDEVLNDPLAHGFQTNGQWWPVWEDNDWALKCGWIGPGESAHFEAAVNVPKAQTVDFELYFPSAEGIDPSDLTLTVQYATPPLLNPIPWQTLVETHPGASSWHDLGPLTLPAGSWVLRWTLSRKATSPTHPAKEALTLLVRNVSLAANASDISLSISSAGVASISNYGPYPEFVTYTLDGSEPTENSSRWVPTQPLRFSSSATLKARAFLDGAYPGTTATAIHFKPAGSGTQDDPWLLASAADFLAFASLVNSGRKLPPEEDNGIDTFVQSRSFKGEYLRLVRDLDLSEVSLPTAGWQQGSLGARDSASFQGTLDGNNCALVRPTFTPSQSPFQPAPSVQSCALVGNLAEGATIQNLILYEPRALLPAGHAYTLGTLVGECNGTLSNCHVLRAQLEATGNAEAYGPLVGTLTPNGSAKVTDCTARDCTYNGTLLADIGTMDTALAERVYLQPPRLSPAPGPLYATSATLRLSLPPSAPAGATLQRWSEKGTWDQAFADYTLSGSETFILRVASADGSQVSGALYATYDLLSRPTCTTQLSLVRKTNDGPIPLQSGTAIEPLTHTVFIEAADNPSLFGDWFITYTLDGSEPTEASPRFDPALGFLLPGECTLRARVFNPPYYAPSGETRWSFSVLEDSAYLASLTLRNATQTNTAKYWSQTFTLQANPPPSGYTFSHWKVIGPLVLPDPTANPLSFRFLTQSSLTLEAVYRPTAPGYRLRLR